MITDDESLVKKVANFRENKKKIVFTNGVFDLLHRGHLDYLNKAKELGDVLIIGLNSDASVKRLKGEERPIISENDRAFMLENLKSVDSVVLFEEDTPLNLIKKIMPDILVKGGDYTLETIVGAKEVMENGGKVEVISFVDGYSTTNLVKKIRD
jgi:rfaE bifunctional protein nucleotidyltransferase chain/domain